MWILIWKDEDGKVHTNVFDYKCDCEEFADDLESNFYSKVLYILYDAKK